MTRDPAPLVLARLQEARDRIAEGFACLADPELARPIPALFGPDGEAVFTRRLGSSNRSHAPREFPPRQQVTNGKSTW